MKAKCVNGKSDAGGGTQLCKEIKNEDEIKKKCTKIFFNGKILKIHEVY